MPIIGSFGAGSAKGFGFSGGSFTGICATGGTITEDGRFKVHTFTGTGTFTVNSLAADPADNEVDYLVVGAGGGAVHGGGGAGGFRASDGTHSGCYCAGPSPLTSGVAGITVTATSFPIPIGAGGVFQPSSGGTPGSSSVFGPISSAGGGGGGGRHGAGKPGGSGGGSGDFGGTGKGTGNVPSVSPPQGNPGGAGPGGSGEAAGGGGGATGEGQGYATGSSGGAGASSSITGSAVVYSVGGNGDCGSRVQPSGANVGTGGSSSNPSPLGPTGSAGTVIIRYRFK